MDDEELTAPPLGPQLGDDVMVRSAGFRELGACVVEAGAGTKNPDLVPHQASHLATRE